MIIIINHILIIKYWMDLCNLLKHKIFCKICNVGYLCGKLFLPHVPNEHKLFFFNRIR